MDPEIVIPTILAIGIAYVVLPTMAIAAADASGPRMVRCPESAGPAAVRIDQRRAMLRMFNDACQRVTACSRWPERAGCDRACESAIV